MIAPVLYTNLGIPKRFAGYAVGPLILIRPQYRGDEGLLAHERTHVRQFWRSFGLMPLRYWLSRRHRFCSEVEAYQAQMQNNPERVLLYAKFISDKYGLDVSAETALAALQREPMRC